MIDRELVEILPIFQGLDATALDRLLTHAVQRNYAKGAAVFQQGEDATHFFLLHRAIHWGPLYKWVHSVHHNSVNPSPWSSLSMHPVEQLGYHGVAFWHLIIPSNPLLALYQLHYAGFGAIPGHVGFDKMELTEDAGVDSHAYIHYLHHKYFEVNYGDGLIPFDKWFGTFHDGSKDGEALMEARYEKKRERANAAAK